MRGSGSSLLATAVVVAIIIGIVVGYYAGKASSRTVTTTSLVRSVVTTTTTLTVTKVSKATMTSPVTLVKTRTVTSTSVAKEIVLIDALGRKIVLQKPASRVVSLAPSITEDICALGLCNSVVGVDSFSKSVKGLPSNVVDVGGYWQPSVEKILSAKPDLVLACSGVPAQEAMAKQLESIGIKVFFLRCDKARNLDDVYWDLEAIATLLGHPGKAQKLVEMLKARVEELEKRLSNTTKPGVALVVYLQKNGVWVAGGGTFQDNLISLAGGRNVFHEAYGWRMVGFEDLLAKNPDYVIVTGSSRASVNKTLAFFETSPLKSLKAFRERHVCVVYGSATDRIDRPSVGVIDAAYILASILHPDKVKPPAPYASEIACIGGKG